MKSIIKIFLYCGVLYLLAACAGGAAIDGPGGSSGGGPVGGGQGQPTIAPGADHQGPTPVEPGNENPSNLTTPDDPDEPEPDPQGPDGFKAP